MSTTDEKQTGDQIFRETRPLSAALKSDAELMLLAADQIESLHRQLSLVSQRVAELEAALKEAHARAGVNLIGTAHEPGSKPDICFACAALASTREAAG